MAATTTDKSAGHIGFAGRYEFFALNGEVYSAPVDCPIRCDVPIRNGARFVAKSWWWDRWGAAEMRALANGRVNYDV